MVINFTINGKPYSVNSRDHPADITLNTFIREHAQLFGTKFYCLEGGCGVCTVTVRSHHPVTNRYYSRGVNSCFVLLNVCNGWDIITIEGLGNRQVGYHPMQERLAHFNGSQCGYCSPGMIMNMFGNYEASEGKMTAEEIENSFAGNLCRCTGYRPILDAMKSFATNCEYAFVDCQHDIEDLQICPKKNENCEQSCKAHISVLARTDVRDHRIWYHPSSLQEVFYLLSNIQDSKYILIGGNTAHGVYPRDPDTEIFIDMNNVIELHSYEIGETLCLGANITLTEVMKILQDNANLPGYEYFSELLKHLDLVAHVQVRNVGSIAGNLIIKHEHNEFISDIFLLLTTIGARIVIADFTGTTVDMTPGEFLTYSMKRKVIIKVILPQLDKNNTLFGSYKVLPRAQNAHAYVNAGFLFGLSPKGVTFSRICFGGINANFIESMQTKSLLEGRNLFLPETLAQTLNILDEELKPDWILPAPSPEYRKKVALGLFYKFILSNAPAGFIKPEYLSGGSVLERPVSSGVQIFDTRKDRWPVNEPVRKLEALWQCSGEANYTNDIPYMSNEVWAAFVPAVDVLATVVQIDPSEALSIEGVIAFYSAKDIPGPNSFVVPGLFAILENEELFCSGLVKYHSQPVGVILATANPIAQYAATKVKILYKHEMRELKIKATLRDRDDSHFSSTEKNITSYPSDVAKTKQICGYFEMGGQFHFSMETQTTVCIPRENGLLLYPSSHYIDLVQVAISNILKIKENRIDIEVRRLGGSFGCKISRSNQVAVACALASWLLNRPVRFVQSIESNMRITGKRFACACDYSFSVNEQGKIVALSTTFYEDMGVSNNESPIEIFTIPSFSNCYEKTSSWVVNGNEVLTDAPSNSWCRAPGTLEGIAMIENIMEHIARVVNSDPVDVRMNNIPKDSEMKKLLPDFVKTTEYRQRRQEIDDFNKRNRWKKRGIAISPMRYEIFYFGKISALVAIYHMDGTVAISHGGVEMGQGINTKAAQVAAFTFGIPLDMVTVKASNSLDGANSIASGGSVTSETVCYAVRKACNELLSRMKPVRDKLKNPTWIDVVKKSHEKQINLVSRQINKVGDMDGYDVWGLACTEVEIDVLTGNFQLGRVDIIEDTGESLSPLIDVGQIEGAFVMGLGYWLTERLVYDRSTGELKTPNTWEYKVPSAKDIPIDFRIQLLQKRPNPKGFLRSKATGETAICLSISALFALRHALDSARRDVGIKDWYQLGAPTTIEDVVLAACHTKADFKLAG